MKPEETEETEYELVTRRLVMPDDLNPNHSIFGGRLISWLDVDLYLYASTKVKITNMVTVAMDKVNFRNPAYLGEVIETKAAVKKIRRSSITVYGKAEAWHQQTDERRLVIECEITYVAVDKEGHPTPALKNFKSGE